MNFKLYTVEVTSIEDVPWSILKFNRKMHLGDMSYFSLGSIMPPLPSDVSCRCVKNTILQEKLVILFSVCWRKSVLCVLIWIHKTWSMFDAINVGVWGGWVVGGVCLLQGHKNRGLFGDKVIKIC